MILDFGNGITTDGITSDIARESNGLDIPEYEIAIVNHSILDGADIGATRAKARRMTIKVIHDRVWSRLTVMRAFAPGILRILTGPRGTIPYYVEAGPVFPDNMIQAEREFTVTIISPLAYILGEQKSLTSGALYGGLEFPFEYPAQYDQFVAVGSFKVTADTDVTAPCRLTAKLATSATEFVFSSSGWTKTVGGNIVAKYGWTGSTRIVGTFASGDVLVVDSETHTVTVNGVNRLAWFDKTSDWPHLSHGPQTLTVSTLSMLTAEWTDRYLGLV